MLQSALFPERPAAPPPVVKPPVVTESLFHAPWWLDAATNGRLERVEVKRDGRVVATMPFMRVRRHWITRIAMPPYTRVLGPQFVLPESKAVTRRRNINELVAELMRAMPSHDTFHHCLLPDTEIATAFIFAGWPVVYDCTFRVPAETTEADSLKAMHWRTRSHIRESLGNGGSKGKLTITSENQIDDYIRLATLQVARGNAVSRHDFATLERLYAACRAHDCVTVLNARNDDNKVLASAVLVYDANVLYFWLGARDVAEVGNRGYTALLWHASRIAHKRKLVFDLDGWASPTAMRYLIHFGAEPIARPIVLKVGLKHQAIRMVRQTALKLLNQPVQLDQRSV